MIKITKKYRIMRDYANGDFDMIDIEADNLEEAKDMALDEYNIQVTKIGESPGFPVKTKKLAMPVK